MRMKSRTSYRILEYPQRICYQSEGPNVAHHVIERPKRLFENC